MASGHMPMLSRGAFATYFGGPSLLSQLDERSGSIVRYDNPKMTQKEMLALIFQSDDDDDISSISTICHCI